MIDNKVYLENKVSNLFQEATPQVVQEEYPLFSKFLKYYYEFLECGELTVDASFTTFIQETSSKNQTLTEGEEFFLSEDSNVFLKGETITGSLSKATSEVLIENVIRDNKVFIKANQKFIIGETITGSVSGATATVLKYRGNPVQNINQLIDYFDVDETVDDFLTRFRDSYLSIIPENLADGVDKRKVLKNINNLYEAKGTKRGHEYFFKLLFDEQANIVYPRDQILRPSDGKWIENKIIRLTAVGSSSASEIIGQQIKGLTSEATAIIESIITVIEGAETVIEATVDEKLIEGTFTVGEEVSCFSNETDLIVKFVVKGIVTDATITDSGQYYNVGDVIDVANAGNNLAKLKVSLVGSGSVDGFIVDDGGSGYAIGDELNFNEDDTNGSGVQAKVRVVGGSFAMEDEFEKFVIIDKTSNTFKLNRIVTEYQIELQLTNWDTVISPNPTYTISTNENEQNTNITIDGSGFLDYNIIAENDDNLLFEDDDTFTLESYVEAKISYTDTQYMKLESGSEAFYGDTYFGTDIVLEEETVNSLDGASEVGAITKVRVIKRGKDYNKLPFVSSITTSGGSGADIITFSNSGIGSVEEVEVSSFGLNYSSSPEIYFKKTFVVKDFSGGDTFTIGNELTTHTATIVSHDLLRNVVVLSSTDDFTVGDTITDVSGVSAVIASDETASGSAIVGYLGKRLPSYLDESGRVSNPSNYLHDNYYYQDFSYVVKINESVDKWRSLLKNSIHPAGWNIFGQLTTSTSVSAKIKSVTGSEVVDYTGDETFTPELASTFENLVTLVFGRRPGTADDGTTLNSTPRVGYDNYEDVPTGQREVTISSSVRNRISSSGVWSGHSFQNLKKYAFARGLTSEETSNYPGITRSISDLTNIDGGYTLKQFGDVVINTIESGDYKVKFAIPSTINLIRTRSYSFDSDVATFDDGTETFDNV